jgi:hypothetical protein
MKRRALIKRIQEAAAARGLACFLTRQGGRHEFWEVGDIRLSIPRHRDINDWTAEAIMRDLERVLGEGWWRR